MDHSSSALCRRRNTSTLVPEMLYPYVLAGKSTSAPPPLNLDFLSSLPYTSLRDVLPGGAVLSSPTTLTPNSAAYQISIRNRLVKQAAWAYLQPMSASPTYSAHGYFHRLRLRFSQPTPITACFRFFFSALTKLVNGLLRIIRHPR